MKEIVKTSQLTAQLEQLFDALNAELFDGKLERPIITVQKSPHAYGHFTIGRVWQVDCGRKNEINIGAGTLDRPIEDIVATLVHEMVHMYNYTVLNIPDCSGSSNNYHNKAFKQAAEARGLICTRMRNYGWAQTAPAQVLLDWIAVNDIQPIKLNRRPLDTAGGKSHSRRYVCPKCGQIARTTKPSSLICGLCHETMTEEIRC